MNMKRILLWCGLSLCIVSGIAMCRESRGHSVALTDVDQALQPKKER